MSPTKEGVAPRAARKRATTARLSRSEGRMHRDWMAMLLPIFITVGISVIANVGVGIWQGATFKAQVERIDKHQSEQDKDISENSKALQALYTHLPTDYVPRKEVEENRARNKEDRDTLNLHLGKIEDKMDTILMNSEHSRR